jgi:hypothetical protein
MTNDITLETIVKQDERVVSTVLDGEVVLIDPETSQYQEMNDVGSSIWQWLEDGSLSVADICNKLREEYEVDEATCFQETSIFLEDLLSKDILQVE